MKPPRNQIINSPPDLDSKQPSSLKGLTQFKPVNPQALLYFEILNSIFFFLLPPMGFYFCLPADEATAKSVKNYVSHATNKNCTGPKWVRTQEPKEEQQAPKTPSCLTPSSPTKAA